jgi:hypothetical protein
MSNSTTKKTYQSIIEACTGINTAAQLHSKLNKVLVSSEDPKLKKLLFPAVKLLTEAHQHLQAGKKGSVKFSIHIDQEPYKALLLYCSECIKNSKPEWQLIAESHGWGSQNQK